MGRHVQVERYKDFLYVSGVFFVLNFCTEITSDYYYRYF